MRIGIRQSFNTMQEFEERFAEPLPVPIELALPWKIQEYFALIARDNALEDITEVLFANKWEVLSVHAPQGQLSRENSREWLTQVAGFAHAVGAYTVVVHPERYPFREFKDYEEAFPGIMRYGVAVMLAAIGCKHDVQFAVETFEGKRLLTPEQIGQIEGVGMCLDVSHIGNLHELMLLITRYHNRIKVLHLSAREGKCKHLPISESCVWRLRELEALGWDGDVVLEYMPEFHHRLVEDAQRVSRLFGGE